MNISSDPTLLLGVDGGGTSTIALLAARDGDVLGKGKAGPSNAKAVGIEAARSALEAAIAAAFDDARRPRRPAAMACLGVAGFDRPDDRQALESWCKTLGWAESLELVNDGDLVVAAGTPEGWGLGVIAGTGSIAVGRAPDGRKARAGGWGYLMGDEGSAYAVVLDALRLVARRWDGRSPGSSGSDPLTRSLCAALSAADPTRMVPAIYAPGFDRARIAALAPAVLEAASDDPEVVERILRPAGFALAEQAAAVARALGWSACALPMAAAGGFLLSAPAVLSSLIDGLAEAGHPVAWTPVDEPARGALAIASRALAAKIASP